MERKKRNYDNDTGYCSPRAWHHLKQCLAKMGNGLTALGNQFQSETETEGGCIRLRLAVVFHHWLSLSHEDQGKAFKDFFGWSESNKETWRNPSAVVRQTGPQNPAASTTGNSIVDKISEKIRDSVRRQDRAAAGNVNNDDDDDNEGEEWKQAGKVSDDLPDADKIHDREFLEVMWGVVAPAGWTLPTMLPADTRIYIEPGDIVPMIVSGDLDSPRKHCPLCEKGYLNFSLWRKHMMSQHGWQDNGRRVVPVIGVDHA